MTECKYLNCLTWQPIFEAVWRNEKMDDKSRWEQDIKKIESSVKFKPEFDLAKHLLKLTESKARRDLIRSEFHEKQIELGSLEKQIKQKIKTSKKLNKQSHNKLLLKECPDALSHLKAKIDVLEKEIQEFNETDGYIISMPQRYSEKKMYIDLLCSFYYEGTGIFPEVKNPSRKGESSYSGNFYDFLLLLNPLLMEIGIELSDKPNVIGVIAWQTVHGVKKEGMPPFAKRSEDQILDIELDPVENKYKYKICPK